MYITERAPEGKTCEYWCEEKRERCRKNADFIREFLHRGTSFCKYYYCAEHLRRTELEDKWAGLGHCSMEDTIKCPYCGADLGTDEPEDYESLSGEDYECGECGKTFELDREVTVEYTYSTRRRVEDMPDGWDGEGENEEEEV